MRGTSAAWRRLIAGSAKISIHVPLAGNVAESLRKEYITRSISIHVPLAGNVAGWCQDVDEEGEFLSTFPLRGTSQDDTWWTWNAEISIHVPLAGNVAYHVRRRAQRNISIHVPLAGNVYEGEHTFVITAEFLSTFPLRGTSLVSCYSVESGIISIHVPLAGNVRCA